MLFIKSNKVKGEKRMARNSIEAPQKERTTIMLSKTLADTLSIHVRKNGDNQTDFITRAIVNQLENEGDISIRHILEMEEEANE